MFFDFLDHVRLQIPFESKLRRLPTSCIFKGKKKLTKKQQYNLYILLIATYNKVECTYRNVRFPRLSGNMPASSRVIMFERKLLQLK